MIIWKGWGVLAVLYTFLCVILAGGISALMGDSHEGVVVGIGVMLSAVPTWFTGRALNVTGPKKKVDEWARARRAQLDDLVRTGQFSLGPGQPQPQSMQEAQAMSDHLFQMELEERSRIRGQHSLFWVPMEYIAYIQAAGGVLVAIMGLVTS